MKRITAQKRNPEMSGASEKEFMILSEMYAISEDNVIYQVVDKEDANSFLIYDADDFCFNFSPDKIKTPADVRPVWSEEEIIEISDFVKDRVTLPVASEDGFSIEVTADWDPDFGCSRVAWIKPASKEHLVLEDNVASTNWGWIPMENALRIINNDMLLSEAVGIATDNNFTVLRYGEDQDYTVFYFSLENEGVSVNRLISSEDYLYTVKGLLGIDIDSIYDSVKVDKADTADKYLVRTIKAVMENGGDFNDLQFIVEDSLAKLGYRE